MKGAAAAAGYRFDVVGVTFPDGDGEPILAYVPNAFELQSG